MCCLGSGVVLDCIDSWSLPSYLLCSRAHYLRYVEGYRQNLTHSCAIEEKIIAINHDWAYNMVSPEDLSTGYWVTSM